MTSIASCPICKKPACSTSKVSQGEIPGLVESYTQEIQVCNSCHYIFVGNPLSSDTLSTYYKLMSKYEGSAQSTQVAPAYVKRARRQFEFVLSSTQDFKSVLEVGAATGYNLVEYKNHGCNVYGVEPSASNRETADQLYGVELFPGTLEEFIVSKKTKQSDLVVLSHVLEHIPNPLEFIDLISSVNQRYLFIEVPSFEAFYADEPYGLFFYEHISFFTVKSLQCLMNKAGYKEVRVNIEYNFDGTAPGYPVIVSLWEKMEAVISSGKKDPFVSASDLLLAYLDSSKERFNAVQNKIAAIPDSLPIAIWGTGSHTSRLFATTDLKSKNIVKFYDSDKKRHNFKIATRSIEAFNPEDSVGTILISSFASELEIKKIIKKSAPNKNVILLYN